MPGSPEDTGRQQAGALVGAWALDALDDDERALVEDWLERDDQLRAEARRLRAATTRLAHDAGATAPPELRQAVLSALAVTAQQGHEHNHEPDEAPVTLDDRRDRRDDRRHRDDQDDPRGRHHHPTKAFLTWSEAGIR